VVPEILPRSELISSRCSLPSHILGSLDELHRKMGRVYDKQFRNNDITEKLLHLYRALVMYSSWRESDVVQLPITSKGLARRAIQTCLRQLADRETEPSWKVVSIAMPALETLAIEVALEQSQAGIQTWLAAWIAMKAGDIDSSGEHDVPFEQCCMVH
jgi:hypothetical protein